MYHQQSRPLVWWCIPEIWLQDFLMYLFIELGNSLNKYIKSFFCITR